MVDPVIAGFIGWICGRLGDKVLKHLVSDKELTQEVDKTMGLGERELWMGAGKNSRLGEGYQV